MRRFRETKKNYKWLAIFAVVSWVIVLLMVFFIDPDNLRDIPIEGSYLIPGILIWLALFLLLTIVLGRAMRGLWWSLGIVIYLYLRIWGVGSLLNGLLLLGFLTTIQVYEVMQKRDKKDLPGQGRKEDL